MCGWLVFRVSVKDVANVTEVLICLGFTFCVTKYSLEHQMRMNPPVKIVLKKVNVDFTFAKNYG